MGMVTQIRSYNTLGGKDHRGSGLVGLNVQTWPQKTNPLSSRHKSSVYSQVT